MTIPPPDIFVQENATIVGAKPAMKRDTRKDILLAAICEFARVGYEGASTLVIAKAAATKQPSLNYHFGSKEKLWQASVDYAFTELTVTFETIHDTVGDMAPVDVLKVMLRTINRFAMRNPKHIDIMRQEMGSRSARTEYLLSKHLVPMYQHINRVIEAAVAAKQIRDYPPAFLSSLLFGAVTHFFSVGQAMDTVYGIDVTDLPQAVNGGGKVWRLAGEKCSARFVEGPRGSVVGGSRRGVNEAFRALC